MSKTIIAHLGTGTYFDANEAFLVELPDDFNDWEDLEDPEVLYDWITSSGKAVIGHDQS